MEQDFWTMISCMLHRFGLGTNRQLLFQRHRLQGFFPVFWEHDPYIWIWEFQRRFAKNWEKILDCNFTIE